MAQGTRRRLLLTAATGFGVVLLTSLAGCQNTDKSKDTKAVTKQPGPGLPGTPTVPTGTAATRTTTPTSPYGSPGTTGATGMTGTTGANSTYNPYSTSVQPAGGTQPGQGMGMGSGFGAGSSQFGSNGNNPLTSQPQTPSFQATPGFRGSIGAPAAPGSMYQSPPPGGGVGQAPPPGGALGSTAANSPPPLTLPLDQLPLPPPPPLGAGSAGNSVAAAPVPPPVAPSNLGPLSPTMPSSTTAGKPQLFGGGVGVFGSQ